MAAIPVPNLPGFRSCSNNGVVADVVVPIAVGEVVAVIINAIPVPYNNASNNLVPIWSMRLAPTRTEKVRMLAIRSPTISGTSLMMAMTVPNTQKNADEYHIPGTFQGNWYNAVRACAKNAALMMVPRTATTHMAAKTGNRFHRKGGNEYNVPNRPDPHNATFKKMDE